MFGLTIIKKSYLEELEYDTERAERHCNTVERKVAKAKATLATIKDNSKQMNKNDIVKMCTELLKELR